MYVRVRILKGYGQPLLYEVPADFGSSIAVGAVVEVPLRTQQKSALVLAVFKGKPEVSYPIKPILFVHQFPKDVKHHSYIQALSRVYFISPHKLMERLQRFVFVDEDAADVELFSQSPATITTLTHAQQAIVTDVSADLVAGIYRPTLIQGVTGSGKTEVYKALIVAAIAQGKTVIFLCPEVVLARQFYALFEQCFAAMMIVARWHSGITPDERMRVWQSAVKGQPMLLVGVHLPVLLPLSNLGLLIIDEEHDIGYEEKQHPRLNSKHAALLRARHYGVPIVLGSATPSVMTLYHAQQQQWRHSFLTERFGGSFPVVEHVVLSKNKKRPHFWISSELLTALADTIFRGQQAIVYLNRRGYGFFLQCIGCGYTFECSSCAVALTLHHDEHAGGYERMLECHYCTERKPLPKQCAQCGTSTDEGKCKGIGTQQLVSVLQKLLPQARIARVDADISKRKKLWNQTIEQFGVGAIDILVGTQIITKGFHFPQVTLVGVVWADSSVHFPVYNAHEVALQQIIQVAGRAGRSRNDGRVIVQSFDNHPLFSFIDELKYPDFCVQELAARQEFGYPPFGRLVTIEVAGELEERVVADAQILKERIAQVVANGIQILGPARPMREKVQGVFYRHLLCKAVSYGPLQTTLIDDLWSDLASTVHVYLS